MKHFVIVGVLVILLTVLTYVGLQSIGLLPVQASQQAIVVDQLFDIHWMLISFLFSLIAVLITYSLVVFRRRPGDNSEGKFFKYNTRLEIVWTVIPLVIVIALALVGSKALAMVKEADPNAMDVKVTGFQWGWQFEYPKYNITSSKELVLPINQQIHFIMTSKDVIHSFWVPEFRIKQDLLPGANLVKELRITPTRIGQYKLLCNQLCGAAHAYMTAPVSVVSQDDFSKWVTQQQTANEADPTKRGEEVARSSGCIGCHSFDGSAKVGPTWKGLAGSQVSLSDGTTVLADDQYLLNSITNPNLQIVQGFSANLMPPNYAKVLSEQQIQDLIAFIKSLK